MKYLLILILIITGVNKFHGQNELAPMEVTKSFWKGVQIEHQGQILTLKEAQNQMEAVPLALQEIKKARKNYALANSLGLLGGVLVGWPLGSTVAGGDPQWVVMGVGLVLVAASIPISYITVKKRAKSAVLHYNEAIGPKEKRTVNFQFSGSGIGIVATF